MKGIDSDLFVVCPVRLEVLRVAGIETTPADCSGLCSIAAPHRSRSTAESSPGPSPAKHLWILEGDASVLTDRLPALASPPNRKDCIRGVVVLEEVTCCLIIDLLRLRLLLLQLPMIMVGGVISYVGCVRCVASWFRISESMEAEHPLLVPGCCSASSAVATAHQSSFSFLL